MLDEANVPHERSLMENLVTEAEAAKMLGRSRHWLREQRLDGQGPMYVDLGNTVKYYPEDVQSWLRSRRTEPTKQTRKPKSTASKKKASAGSRKTAAPTAKSE